MTEQASQQPTPEPNQVSFGQDVINQAPLEQGLAEQVTPSQGSTEQAPAHQDVLPASPQQPNYEYQQPSLQEDSQNLVRSDQVYPTPSPEEIMEAYPPLQPSYQQPYYQQQGYQEQPYQQQAYAQPGMQAPVQQASPSPYPQGAAGAPSQQGAPGTPYQQSAPSTQYQQSAPSTSYSYPQGAPSTQYQQGAYSAPSAGQPYQQQSYQQPYQQPYYQQQGYQPGYQTAQAPLANNFGIYLTLSILSAVFCGGLLAIPAIVYAAMMNTAFKRGNYAEYSKNRNVCRIWLIVAVCIGVVVNIVGVVLYFEIMNSLSSYDYLQPNSSDSTYW